MVPKPVRVKNAGMPAPPARSRSAKVPCGLNSSSNSPDKYCRSNSLFSPTYEEIIFLICRVLSNMPKPMPSTPALLEIAVKPVLPESRKARIKASGMPHKPKPPTAMVCPSLTISCKAALALSYNLFFIVSLKHEFFIQPRPVEYPPINLARLPRQRSSAPNCRLRPRLRGALLARRRVSSLQGDWLNFPRHPKTRRR